MIFFLGRLLGNLSSYLILQGRFEEAWTTERESFQLVRNYGGYALRLAVQRSAMLAASEGDLGTAASLIGFVDAGFSKTGEARLATERSIRAQLIDILQKELPETEIEKYRG